MGDNKVNIAGESAEVQFVIDFNLGKFSSFVKNFYPTTSQIFAVRVTSHQFSATSQKLVKPKADAYLVTIEGIKKSDLKNFDYFLDEGNLSEFKYVVVPSSGVSIKKPDSSRYQIHKFPVTSFLEVFNDACLGAGAMMYLKEEKMQDNEIIRRHWGVSHQEFCTYFSRKLNLDLHSVDKSLIAIQRYCLNEIKEQIVRDESIRNLVFSGEGVFASPYFARYEYIASRLGLLQFRDFSVTQGSGRTDNPTIVVKPG
jgi:hypothetical protein